MMETKRKGLLTPSQEKVVANLIKLTKVKAMVRPFILTGVKIFDNVLLEKIPESWQSPIEPIIDLLLLGKLTEAQLLATQVVNDKINIPLLDEELERDIFEHGIKFILSMIKKYIPTVIEIEGEGESVALKLAA